MIIQVSVFTWLEFHFIRENMKITEIPRIPTTRITFRYNKRDDLHEVAYFIGIATIAVYMSIDLQDTHVVTSDAVAGIDAFYLSVFKREIVQLLIEVVLRMFFTTRCISVC